MNRAIWKHVLINWFTPGTFRVYGRQTGHYPETGFGEIKSQPPRWPGHVSHKRTSGAFVGVKGISRQESAAGTVGKHCGVTRDLSNYG